MQAEMTLKEARQEIDAILNRLAVKLPQCKAWAMTLCDRMISVAQGDEGFTNGELLLAWLALAVETMRAVEEGVNANN